jgi:molecular chaperone IbpA
MLDLFFPTQVTPLSRRNFSPESSMKHEMELLNMARNMLDSAKPQMSFPKYNIYRMLDGNPNICFMEFALAGYNKSDLDVKLSPDGYLTVSGSSDANRKEDREYLQRGLARRDFTSKFYVGKDVVVRNASFSDGLLTVEVESLTPQKTEDNSIPIK